MLQFITLLALIGCALAGTVTPGHLGGRIVGGVETTIEQYPHQVSLQSKSTGRHQCGGSIYKSNIVVTAAHCVEKRSASQFSIRLGSTDHTLGRSVNVTSIISHPGYNPRTFFNDVAVMKLGESVKESSKVKYVQLAKVTPENGAEAVVTGWGTECSQRCPSSVNILRKVGVNIVDSLTCGSEKYGYGSSSITTNMVCAQAKGKDACQGDSGGPLVIGDTLVGIVSWGNGCAESSYPGVYADVAVLRDWIEKTAAGM